MHLLLLHLFLIFHWSISNCCGFGAQLVETFPAHRSRGALKSKTYHGAKSKSSVVRVNPLIVNNNNNNRDRHSSNNNNNDNNDNNDRSSLVALFSNNNDGNENDNDNDRENVEKVGMNLSDGIELLSSYIIQFLGVALSLGLVLNVCGFGYTIDLERGLRIDRVENLRREYRFQKAQKEIMRASQRPGNLSLENSADDLLSK